MKKIIVLLNLFIVITVFGKLKVVPRLSDLDHVKYGVAPGVFEPILPPADTTVSDPNFMVNYFENLNEFGYNITGTCAYVATSMLMSYYDSFWNDNIILENYDVNTTLLTYSNSVSVSNSASASSDYDSLRNEIFYKSSAFGKFTFLDYYNFINNNYNNYHHIRLIRNFNAIQEYLLEYNDEMLARVSENDIILSGLELGGLTASQIYSLLNSNLSSYGNISSITTNVKNQVINKIRNKIPVVLCVGNGSGSGHVVVAYDYDESTGKIYVHSGLRNSQNQVINHITIENLGYSNYDCAFYFTPTSTHNCSDNYNYNFVSYCICDLDGTHSCHQHHYNIINERLMDYHNLECICTCESITYHTIVSGTEYYNSSGARCALCYYCNFELVLNTGTIYYTIYI